MSLILNGSTQYAYSNTPAVTDAGFTVSVWFQGTDVLSQYALWSEDSGSSDNIWSLEASGHVANDPIRCMAYKSGWSVASSTAGFSAGSWQHACGIWEDAAVRDAFVNGGSKGSVSASKAVVNLAIMYIGKYINGGFLAGKIAEVAVWDTTLSDAEVALLAGGTLPTSVQAGHLIAYWPLLNDANDDVGSNNLSLVGTPSFDSEDHPSLGPSYVDATATLSGSGSLTATATLVTIYDLSVTLAGTGTLTATASVIGGIPSLRSASRKMIIIGNDSLYYQD